MCLAVGREYRMVIDALTGRWVGVHQGRR